jgi:hypothetical protein
LLLFQSVVVWFYRADAQRIIDMRSKNTGA